MGELFKKSYSPLYSLSDDDSTAFNRKPTAAFSIKRRKQQPNGGANQFRRLSLMPQGELGLTQHIPHLKRRA